MTLKPRREVVTPHPDGAAGRYRQAEFVADLADVLAGAAEAEYQDPVGFFSRNHLAKGARLLPTTVVNHLVNVGARQLHKADIGSKGGVEYRPASKLLATAWPNIEGKARDDGGAGEVGVV